MLGAITLDLFAVLFGGAVALLPAVREADPPHRAGRARRSCAARPQSAPCSPGSCSTHRPLARPHRDDAPRSSSRAFGVSMIVFGLSKSLSLSVVALAVERLRRHDQHEHPQRRSRSSPRPNELRGRVNAVESVFISASNELGAFESGRRGGAARRGARRGRWAASPRSSSPACWRWVFPDLATHRPDRRAPARTGGVPDAAL